MALQPPHQPRAYQCPHQRAILRLPCQDFAFRTGHHPPDQPLQGTGRTPEAVTPPDAAHRARQSRRPAPHESGGHLCMLRFPSGQLPRRGHPQRRAPVVRPECGNKASDAPRPRHHLWRTRPLQTAETIPAELSPHGTLAHCPLGRSGRPLRRIEYIDRSGTG